MPLAPGQTLTHYTILGPLGAGGMGEVYRARDTRLEREVAIKVLPAGLADDADRLMRFEREAKTLASLNHPNVGGIHAVDHEGGLYFLALELVPGEDLSARLERGALPLDEALDVCRQIAEGLEAAHEAGVVHRDLKPANVRITPQGVVKLLDFGLAKPIGPRSTGSGSGTSRAQPDSFLVTEAGMVLGTPTYMSPEQARGRLVDRRTDIWAFGCVLYECLTGRRAFGGDSVTDILAAVVQQEPDWSALPGATPAHVRALLERCLVKDPRTRLRDIGEARLVLSGVLPPDADAATTTAPASRSPWLPWSIAAAAVVVAAFLAWRPFGRSGGEGSGAPVGAASTRSEVRFEPRTFGKQVIYNGRFLPNGQSVVYSAALTGNRPSVYLLHPESQAAQEIAPAGTLLLSVSAAGELAVLTDARYLNHRVHQGTLARMSVEGAPRALVENVRDADWGPDGELAIVHREGGLDRLEYPIGTVIYETSGYVSEPRVAPDGRQVAFLDHPFTFDDRGWVKIADLAGEVRTLTEECWAVEGLAWTDDGRRLLYSAAFDDNPTRMQPLSVAASGGQARVELSVPGELMVVDTAPGGRWLAVQLEQFYGVAVRLPDREPDLDLSWLDLCWSAFLSRDGEELLFTNGHGGANYAVVTRRLDGSPIQTLGEGEARGYSPDGRWVLAQISSPPGLALYPTGAGKARLLERGPIDSYETAQWFPDGEHLLVVGSEPGRPLRAWRQALAGGTPQPVTAEGIVGLLSPRGDVLLGLDETERWCLFPLDGSDPRVVPGLTEDDEVFGWGPDGDAAFVAPLGQAPARLERVELATGEREPGELVGPPGEAGLVRVWCSDPLLDPERGFAYGYRRILSKLFVVEGLR